MACSKADGTIPLIRLTYTLKSIIYRVFFRSMSPFKQTELEDNKIFKELNYKL